MSGRLEDSAVEFYKDLASESAAVKGLPAKVIFYTMMKQISSAFYRGVVEVITGRLYGILCPRESKYQQATAEMADRLMYDSSHTLVFDKEDLVVGGEN